MIKYQVTIFVVLGMASQPILADQQQWLEKADAARALIVVNQATSVRSFCAPCNESHSELQIVTSAEVKSVHNSDASVSDAGWSLYINGQPVDLAYIYIPQETGWLFWRKDRWQNLAIRLALPVSDVDEFLSPEQLAVSVFK